MKQSTLLRYIAAIALTITALTACVDDAGNIGASLIDEEVAIAIDSNFTVTGHSMRQPMVQSRTTTQMLGRIHVKGYGSLSSTVVTQFMPSARVDTTHVTPESIDSVRLTLAMNKSSFIGDSIIPMGLALYPLTTTLQSPIYSDFDPQGKYDTNDMMGSTIYNLSTMSKPDSIAKLASYYINIKLPLQFGRKLYTDFRRDPKSFSTPGRFINDVFKGLYITNTYGSGRLIGVAATTVEVFFHKTYYDSDRKADTTVYASNIYMGVTPEVVTNNNLTFTIDDAISSYIDQGQTIILSPAGYEAAVTMPIRQLKERFLSTKGTTVLNDLTFEIPVDSLPNDGKIGCPPYLLLLKESQRDEFFAQNRMTDNITSFYAPYDSQDHTYKFTGMRKFLLEHLNSEVTDADQNYLLIPVQVNFESNPTNSYYSYLYGASSTSNAIATTITPFVLPSMARLRLNDAKIKLTFCSQYQKNY